MRFFRESEATQIHARGERTREILYRTYIVTSLKGVAKRREEESGNERIANLALRSLAILPLLRVFHGV